jgi:hypothetical protein
MTLSERYFSHKTSLQYYHNESLTSHREAGLSSIMCLLLYLRIEWRNSFTRNAMYESLTSEKQVFMSDVYMEGKEAEINNKVLTVTQTVYQLVTDSTVRFPTGKRNCYLFHRVQTHSASNLTSYAMCMGLFPRG